MSLDHIPPYGSLFLIKTPLPQLSRLWNIARTSADHISNSFRLERLQIGITIIAALLIISLKASSNGQSDIISALAHTYTEETSASVIEPDQSSQIADINSLMSGQTSSVGQGGTAADDTEEVLPYTLADDSVQAIDAVSKDFLDDYKSNKIATYTVQPGDALSFIASDFGVTPDSIIWANHLASAAAIKPGQILKIPPVSGVIHTIRPGDSIASIARTYGVEEDKILSFNDLNPSSTLIIGSDLVVPQGTIPYTEHSAVSVALSSVPAAFRSSVVNEAERFAYLPDLGSYFIAPTEGFDWGIVHDRNGVDIANSCGTDIDAAANGTVITALSSGWNGGFGRYIKIAHSNGTETLYGHLSKLLVKEGDQVTQGQEIALMGTTGHSTGCHLHFEVHGARNPMAKY